MADESSYAARVFPSRPPSSSLMPPRDVLRQGLGEIAQAALRMPGAMLRDWWKWRTAQLTPEAVQESAQSGGPMGTGALGGVLRAPLLGTKVKYLHPKTGEEPTRVFHGTTQTFEKFDPGKADPHGLYGPGFYFTENPTVSGGTGASRRDLGYARPSITLESERVASEEMIKTLRHQADLIRNDPAGAVARYRDPAQRLRDIEGSIQQAERNLTRLDTVAPQVRPAHLDIRNPFDIESRMAPDEVRRLLTEAGHPMAQTPQNLEGYVKSNLTGEGLYGSLLAHLGSKDAVNTFLQRAGYDGITHRGGRISGGDPHQVWIAFRPEQVVSPFEYAATHTLTP
jgi:hypothetical protein